MRKIIITALIAVGFVSVFGTTALLAQSETETINQKAQNIVADAKIKGDKIIQEAKARANAILVQAKKDAQELKEESVKSIKNTSVDAKNLANEAIEKTKSKSSELVKKAKAMPQVVKQGIEDKYIYTKEAINKTYQESKVKANNTLILATIKYAYLMSSDIHSMKIDVTVKDGVVELFGKVKSANEAQKAMEIALSTKGVIAVKSFFVIE